MLDSKKKLIGLHLPSAYLEAVKNLPKGMKGSHLLLLPFIPKRRFGEQHGQASLLERPCTLDEKLLIAFQTFPLGYHYYVLCQLAQDLGYTIENPMINDSNYLPVIQEKKIIMGFVHIPFLSGFQVSQWIKEREKRPYLSLDDFFKRNPVSQEVLKALVKAEVFRVLHRSTKALEWMLDTYTNLTPIGRTATIPWAYKKLNYLSLLGNPWEEYTTDLPSHYQVAAELPHLHKEEVDVLGRVVSLFSFPINEYERVQWGIFTDEEQTVYLGKIEKYPGISWKIGGMYFLAGSVKGTKAQPWVHIQTARYLG